MKQIASVYARLKNPFKFIYQIEYSARYDYDKQDENDQVFDEIDLYIDLKFNKMYVSYVRVLFRRKLELLKI